MRPYSSALPRGRDRIFNALLMFYTFIILIHRRVDVAVALFAGLVGIRLRDEHLLTGMDVVLPCLRHVAVELLGRHAFRQFCSIDVGVEPRRDFLFLFHIS